jgi:hypothetical protein
MPHLDFREALSTPEQQVLPTPAATIPVAAVPVRTFRELLRGLGVSRSTWANIVFVAIASVGGIVCAFYFFNGGELLQAAASWPREYLYPRPLSPEQIALAKELRAFDQFADVSDDASNKTADIKNVNSTNGAPTNVLQAPTIASAPVTPPAITPPSPPSPPGPIVLPPVPPIPPTPPSLVVQITNDVNRTVGGADAFVQSIYQTATATQPLAALAQTSDNTVKSSKRKVSRVSSAKQKAVTTTTNSTARNLQQSAVNQSMSATRPMNQIMSSGGLGGMGSAGLIGSVGGGGAGSGASGAASGVGSGAGSGVGSVGSVGGGVGSLGGLGGAGLGGGVAGGVGGTVGGVVGGHH